MKYTVQFFTGGWKNPLYEKDVILKRIIEVTQLLDVKRIIIGWNLETEIYKEVKKAIGDEIELYLWLPVFSEIGMVEEMKPAIDIYGKQVAAFHLQEGESFTFYCPSAKENHQSILKVFDENFKDIGFDGVFLDKIRSQSFVAGLSGVMSCCCHKCQELFLKEGVELDEIRQALAKKSSGEVMAIADYQEPRGITFADEKIQRFMRGKQEILTRQLESLVLSFRKRELKIGMDVFYPFMSWYVGQNIYRLSQFADFIKPMMYRKTWAPAGMSFEYHTMEEALGCKFTHKEISPQDLEAQVRVLVEHCDCAVAPGIEVNYDEKIARTSEGYIQESIRGVKSGGGKEVVLSWDLMKAPMEHLIGISKEAG
ncbi:DNA-binding transcriptional MerR regulator [Aequitasia blattaphilus]|uniref:Glycosyl hydrolase-like 10 domain-containing protein n=1 Tax=Aequitasia blattaphilus TaxID=2949332 RepID=A0ABT1EA62_9FIRM|nr:hypothetical protein [Aequitasia blattaphilus]MCP1102705.1 hypothetical protein [Aequitasia blattaphilus]MCR8615345.1 hypothetical protein [Aequitasia blattaphilus]